VYCISLICFVYLPATREVVDTHPDLPGSISTMLTNCPLAS
jgi:hypothetical protein